MKGINVDGKNVAIQMWDTAGQERLVKTGANTIKNFLNLGHEQISKFV